MSWKPKTKGEIIAYQNGRRDGILSTASKDLAIIYPFTCIHLHNEGYDQDQINEFLNKVQELWFEWAETDRKESPKEMCRRITGIDLIQ